MVFKDMSDRQRLNFVFGMLTELATTKKELYEWLEYNQSLKNVAPERMINNLSDDKFMEYKEMIMNPDIRFTQDPSPVISLLRE
jgi:hypothetical protein